MIAFCRNEYFVKYLDSEEKTENVSEVIYKIA